MRTPPLQIAAPAVVLLLATALLPSCGGDRQRASAGSYHDTESPAAPAGALLDSSQHMTESPATPTAVLLDSSQYRWDWTYEVKVKPVSIPAPRCPAPALRPHVPGQVTVKVLVGTTGTVSKAQILQSSENPAFDSAAMEAARKALFEPARQRGKPVAARRAIRYTFPPEK